MARLDTFTQQELEQLNKHKQLKPVRLLPRKRKSELDDVVVDPEQLHLKRAINQIRREFRELELQEIIRKYSRESD